MKQNYNLLTRLVTINAWNFPILKNKINFALVVFFTFLGLSNAFGQSPVNDNVPGIGKTFVVPTNVTHVNAAAWGAGGGGGGSNSNNDRGNGGGGGGASSIQIAVAVTNTFTYDVGTAGTAGAAGNNGSNGTASIITSATPLLTLTGGFGTGGLANNVAITAGNSSGGVATGSVGAILNNGSAGIKGTPTGNGGNSGLAFTVFGTGGTGGNDAVGNPGGQPGAGGGGGVRSGGTSRAGGAGAPGRVMFDYITVSNVTPTPVCEGSTITITGTNFAAGTTTVSINGTACTSITFVNATTITAVVGAGTTSGIVDISNNGRRNNGRSITVNPSPANPGNPTSNSPQCNPPGVTLTRTGAPPAGVTWYWQTTALGTSTANSGATFVTTTSGTYYLRAQNDSTGCWSPASGFLTVVVNNPPTITTQPTTPTAVCAGTGVRTISVTATGATTHQWRKNGINLTNTAPYSGVTTATLTITNPNISENGAIFDVITGTAIPCSATSNSVTLTVNPSPVAITGGAATVCVGATTPAFINSGGTWSITDGTGSATISPGGVVTGVSAGTATVVYSIGSCTVSTGITVNATPTITTNPSSASIAVGANTSFSVVANNTPNVSGYVWQVSTDGGFTWTTIVNGGVYSNATTATLNITGATIGMSGYMYHASASNTCGTSSYSTNATLTVSLAYCTPTGNIDCTINDYISNITLNTLNNTSTCSAGGYINYPATGTQTTSVTKGSTYNFSFSAGPGTLNHGAGVWIDFNQNGVFTDAGEFFLISNTIAPSTTTVIPITIPAGAATGNLRMRVRYAYSITVASTMSCTMTGTYGETEDYTITTLDATPCLTPAAQPTALNLSPAGTSISGSFTAASPAPTNYLVVISTSATAPTPVNGTSYSIGGTLGAGYTIVDNDTNNTFTATGLNPSTLYYVYVFSFNNITCTGGPAYLTTTPLTLSATTLVASYCTPTGNLNCTTDNDFISNVTFNTLNNTSTCGAGGYTNYPAAGAQTTSVMKGSTHNFSLSVGTGSGTHGAGVWIDFNQNGVFTDAGEFFLISNTIVPSTTTVIPITIPTGAATGNLRMRVRYAFSTTVTSTMSCTMAGTYGETEDYTITTFDAPPCLTPAAQPTAISLSPAGTSISGSFTTASPAAENYLVVISTSATPPSAPTNGTSYTIGGTLAPGYTIVNNDNNTSFTVNGLTPLTTYYFYIYSFNSQCSGGPFYLGTGPLTGTTTTTTSATYCTPTISATYATSTNHHIRKVEFIGTLQDITNTSTFSTIAPIGYQNFTGLAVKSIQAKGEGVNIYMESPNSGFIKAWVDWNNDGDFLDAGETVYDAGGVSQASTTLGFIVPTAISAGDYRVRLRISGRNISGTDAGYSWNSCSTNLAYYGETEDYILRVIENCAAKITSVTGGNVCGSGSVTLNATASPGTTEFRWYAAQTGGAQLPGSPTATGTWNTPSISTTTTYWVTAWNGTCETLVRAKVIANVKTVPTLTFATSNTEICGENSIVALTAGGDTEIIHLLNENFEAGIGTFSNVHYVNNAAVNTTTAWQIKTGPYVPTGTTWFPAIASNFGANNFAFVNSDIGTYTGPPAHTTYYYVVDNGLVSNTVNSTGFLDLTFKFRMYFDRYYPNTVNPADELMTIDVSTNGGTTWTPFSGDITSDVGYGTRFTDYSYNLSAYINQTNLKVRIRYYTNTWANGAAVDDIELYGTKALNTAFQWSGTSLPDAYTDAAATTTPYIAGTPATVVYVKPTLAQLENGSYTFTATAVLTNGCNVSQNITITNKSKIWKGTADNNWYNASNWSPAGIPDANSCVIIPDIASTSNRPSEINTVGSSAFGKTLIVKNNGVLKLYPSNNLTISDVINVAASGAINMENSSNLVQIANVTNIGNINMKRIANIRKQDYVYWSSPVASFASNAVTPGTSLGYQYKWLPTTGGTNNFGNWAFANETMVLGRGYCLRGPDAYSPSAHTNYSASFIGVPNNGNITIPISRGTWNGGTYSTGVSSTLGTNEDDNWNLVGNPYPSAINAIKFLTLNTNIEGFVYIWTHGTLPSNAAADPFYNDYAYNYTPTDYITYNSTGASTPLGFNGFIGAGQGFFISMLHASASPTENLTFNNTLRRDVPTGNTYNNGQFFKTSNKNSDANDELEKHRIWFDLVTPSGTSARSLLGYVENATDQNDRMFDAFADQKLSFNIFSLIEDEQMLIQGRKLPFDSNDKVNIGVSLPQNGLYKIAIGSVDGLFLENGQNIYLEDKLLNIIYNLKDAPYSFIGNKGTIKDRFVLRFAKNTNAIELTNQLTVYDNNVLTVESGKLKIKNIQIFDVLGKQLINKNNVNNTTYQVNNLTRTNSLMIVKVTLEDNSEEVRKVIY